MAKKKKKLKIPKVVLELRMSPKKFAKKHDIKISGKKMGKKEKKRRVKKLRKEYSSAVINGLNKAVKILAENKPDTKKIDKVTRGVDNVITSPEIMHDVAKLYKKDPSAYPNMIYLPYMIVNTINHATNKDGLTEDEKKEVESLDIEEMVMFCKRILKKQIKHYRKHGFDDNDAFMFAAYIPSNTGMAGRNSRVWYKRLIEVMYMTAKEHDVDVADVLKAVWKLNKKSDMTKREFYDGFYSEFLMQKRSNKNHSFSDTQKELNQSLIEMTLNYLDDMKQRRLREILRGYIKRRKTAESYKNDSKRVIVFTDHANSNSPYSNIKTVVQDLIADNNSLESYLA